MNKAVIWIDLIWIRRFFILNPTDILWFIDLNLRADKIIFEIYKNHLRILNIILFA